MAAMNRRRIALPPKIKCSESRAQYSAASAVVTLPAFSRLIVSYRLTARQVVLPNGRAPRWLFRSGPAAFCYFRKLLLPPNISDPLTLKLGSISQSSQKIVNSVVQKDHELE